MADQEDDRARLVLAEMQMRISQGPHSALGISESSSAVEVRRAFLGLTKQFHPARFGRMSPDVARLSNEVFLGIKSAHDQLIKMLGSSGRITPARGSALLADGSSKTPAPQITGPMPRASVGTQPPTTHLARGTERAASPPMPTTKRISQVAAQPGRPTPAGGVPVQPTPATGVPAQRPTTPIIRTTPNNGVPLHSPPRASTSPVRPSPPGVNPATIRYAGVQPVATQPLPKQVGILDEETELRRALELLDAKNWAAARQVLHALAAKVPQSKQYRSLLCYTRGREAQSSGRAEEAILELQRAVQLDPDLAVAKQALGELQRRRW